jgi:polysaccharide pyruvyl transferase WcaK-like protein
MIHHVYANQSNIGDWLSAIGIQSLLAALPMREHFCDEPFIAETLENLSRLSEDDLLIIGGGGLFMDYFTPLWQGLERMPLRTPMIIWGVGYCDLKQEPSQPPIDLIRRIVARARHCFVRDEITRRLLDQPDLPPPSGCPSLCAINKAATLERAILHVDNYTTAGAEAFDAMDAASRAFAETTSRMHRNTNNRIEPGRRNELERILSLYQRSDVVLSSALHGCILALAMGRKVLAVSGDWKIEGFMDLVGLRDWVLSIDQLDELPARLAMIGNQPDSSPALDRLREQNRAIAEQVRS